MICFHSVNNFYLNELFGGFWVCKGDCEYSFKTLKTGVFWLGIGWLNSALPNTILISFPPPQLLSCKRKTSAVHGKRGFGNNRACK